MKYVFIILISLLSFTSCNYSRNPETDFIEILDDQEKCFLDFRLGMRDYKYEKLVKEYIGDGILHETLIPREYDADLRILSYNFEAIELTGELEALIYYDRLKRLSILFEEENDDENNTTIILNKYEKLVNYFTRKYGKPTDVNTNAQSIHRSTIWERENYILLIWVYQSIDESKNKISISFDPADYLEKAFDFYNEEKKIEQGKLQ